MALPKIDVPIFNITVPVLDINLKLRPYLMKEEKILLMAQQSDDQEQLVTALKQIINNCIIEGDFDVDTAPSFAIEYIMLQLRKESVGAEVKARYRDIEDNQIYDFDINLNEVELKVDPSHSDSIEITSNIGLLMNYPSLSMLKDVSLIQDNVDFGFDIIKKSIDRVFSDEEIFEFNTFSDQEQNDFLEQFDQKQMQKVINFFETLPSLYYKIDYTNSNGSERSIELTTLSDFFT